MPENEDGVVLGDEIIGELSEEDPVERAVFIALDEAANKLDEQGGFDPFIIIVEGDEIHIEEQSGDDEDEIIELARQTVFQMENIADAYIMVYDGYVDLDDGRSDAIIVEFARKGEPEAQVLAWLYHSHDDHVHFQEPLYTLGMTTSLFLNEDDSEDDSDDVEVADVFVSTTDLGDTGAIEVTAGVIDLIITDAEDADGVDETDDVYWADDFDDMVWADDIDDEDDADAYDSDIDEDEDADADVD